MKILEYFVYQIIVLTHTYKEKQKKSARKEENNKNSSMQIFKQLLFFFLQAFFLSMALRGCGDGGSLKLAMMDACNHACAQESVRRYGRESIERNVHDSETNRWTSVLPGFEKPPIYRSRLIEISMVTHHSPDSDREWEREG